MTAGEAGGAVAVVGCGWAGWRHAASFVAEGAELRVAVDLDRERAASVAALQPGARVAARLEEALADPAVTMVDVCLPHRRHAGAVTEALRAGRDVLCEKPLAPSLAEADEMAACAEEAGRLLMVAENECFHPVYRRVRALLDAGAIGKPALVQATRECYLRESFLGERRWFLSREESGGGMLLSGGIHDFAKLRLMLGEIASVQAMRARQRFEELETEDTVVLLLGFACGAVGTLVESFVMIDPTTLSGSEVHRLRIDGDTGSIELVGADRLRVTTADGARELEVAAEDSFRAEVHEFLDCVATRREPSTSARLQRRNLEVVEAAYASIASGAPVAL